MLIKKNKISKKLSILSIIFQLFFTIFAIDSLIYDTLEINELLNFEQKIILISTVTYSLLFIIFTIFFIISKKPIWNKAIVAFGIFMILNKDFFNPISAILLIMAGLIAPTLKEYNIINKDVSE